MRRALWLWLPVLAWAGLIFALSAQSNLRTELGIWDLVLRKIGHAVEFGVLALLVLRATRSLPLALVAASGYAATDEYHQSFVEGRVGTPKDWAIDTAGVLIALGIAAQLRRRRPSEAT